jgi:hypothetical protein
VAEDPTPSTTAPSLGVNGSSSGIAAAAAFRAGRVVVRLEDEDEQDDDQNQDQHATTDVHRDPLSRMRGLERCLPPGRA